MLSHRLCFEPHIPGLPAMRLTLARNHLGILDGKGQIAGGLESSPPVAFSKQRQTMRSRLFRTFGCVMLSSSGSSLKIAFMLSAGVSRRNARVPRSLPSFQIIQ
jgi:hypothetical protein